MSIVETCNKHSISLTRSPSHLLLIPRQECANPIFYGVECFSPTLIDFYFIDDDTRLLWSSRSHRKTFRTLHLALQQPQKSMWQLYSWSIWSALFSVIGACLFMYAGVNESWFKPHGLKNLTSTDFPLVSVRHKVDWLLCIGALAFLIANGLEYMEVINCCHDLEVGLKPFALCAIFSCVAMVTRICPSWRF
jgi:hypothetical protein